MQRWEYCQLKYGDNEVTFVIFGSQAEQKVPVSEWQQFVAYLGNEGWELTSTFTALVTGHSRMYSYYEYSFYFKRPLNAGSNDPTFIKPSIPPL